MKPYFESAECTIYHGDALEVCAKFSRQSINLILTDPPYEETNFKWDHWPGGWPVKLIDLLFNGGSMWCFGSMRLFMEYAFDFAQWNLAQDVVWEKQNGSGSHNDRFRRVHELIAQFYPKEFPWSEVYKDPQYTFAGKNKTIRRTRKPDHWNGINSSTYRSSDNGRRLQRSVIYAKNSHGNSLHKTQKPLAALIPLIQYSCPRGGNVLDPFMGSGSTLEAARMLGRISTGIDIDERNCEIAAKRLSQRLLIHA